MKKTLPLLLLLPALVMGYSLFSLGRPGEPQSPVDARGHALGNTVLGLWDTHNLSLLNPANLAGLSFSTLTLSAGFELNSYTVAAGTSDYATQDLPNLQFAFALSDSFALALGIQNRQSWKFLYSTTVYDDVDPTEEIGTATVEGKGQVNALNLAFGYKPSDNLGLGLRVTGLMGDPHEIWTVDFTDDDYIDTTDTLTSEIRGFAIAAGLNLRFSTLNVGAYFEYPILGEVTKITESGYGEVSREEVSFGYPANLGLGIGWQPNAQFSITADFRYDLWSGFTIDDTELGYNDAWHAGLGVEFIPTTRYNAIFLARMPWRLGGYYETLYDSPTASPFNEWGVTAGTGFFVGENDESSIDFAFQYAQRGALAENNLEEKFLRFYLTFNGAENWFE